MPETQTIMIVGSGGREHTISAAYEHSDSVKRIVIAPGNDYHTWNRQKEVIREPAVSLYKSQTVLEAAQRHKVDLVDVAQDDALAAGTIDLLEQHGIRAFGPTKAAAQIEWDKGWSRGFMERHGIPVPANRLFTQTKAAEAAEYLEKLYIDNPARLVFVKAAGLCAGKGALSARSQAEATARITQLQQLGPAGESFVIEQGLVGEEFSYYAISDGQHFRTFPSAQDNKLSHDGDTGEQTGGMGATSPAALTTSIAQQINEQIIAPAINGLRQEGRPFRGILYLGGIITPDGLNTIEFNARWGDPEIQTILPGLKSDYLALVEATPNGGFEKASMEHDGLTRVCIVGASKGYPGDYSAVKGMEIIGLERASEVPGVTVYGVAIAVRDGKFYADGGRLFNIVGAGQNVAEAQMRAYEAMDYISIEGDNLHYRTDIGEKEAARRA